LSSTGVLVGDGEGLALGKGAGHNRELTLVVVGGDAAVSSGPARLACASASVGVARATAVASVGALADASGGQDVVGVGGLQETLNTAVRDDGSVRILILTHGGNASQTSGVGDGSGTPQALACGDDRVVLGEIGGLHLGAYVDGESGRRRRGNRGRRGNGLRRRAIRETLVFSLGIALAATRVIVTHGASKVVAPAVIEVGEAVVQTSASHRVVTGSADVAATLIFDLARELSRVGVPAPAVINGGCALVKSSGVVKASVRVQEVLAIIGRAATSINDTSGPAICVGDLAVRESDTLTGGVDPESLVLLDISLPNTALEILLHGVTVVNEPFPAVLFVGRAVLKTHEGLSIVLEGKRCSAAIVVSASVIRTALGILEGSSGLEVAIFVNKGTRFMALSTTVAETGARSPVPSTTTGVSNTNLPAVILGNVALSESSGRRDASVNSESFGTAILGEGAIVTVIQGDGAPVKTTVAD